MLRRSLILLLAAALVLTAAAGAARRDEQQPLVTVTTFAITGHGWGHGVGMAQWGAYGYAQHGLAYDQILAHYYPGTQLGQAPVAKVRVLIAAGSRKLTISSESDFSVRDGDGSVHQLKAGDYTFGPRLRLRRQQAQARAPLPAPAVFLPGSSPLQLGLPYRGSIEISVSGGRLQAVNVVGLDAYARGVVSAEMPHDWPLEAVKAQAVAARSYALAGRRGGAFDVYSDTRDQVYGGITAETPVGDQAVAETSRQVLFYDGKVATTYFFSSSGGRTAALEDVFQSGTPVPYLVPVDDPYDTLSPYHNWGPVLFSGAQVSRRLAVPRVSDLQPAPATGHARTVAVFSAGGEVPMPAPVVRRALGLRSTWFRAGVFSLSRPQGAVAPGTAVTLTGVVLRLPQPVLEQRTPGLDWQLGSAIEPAADGTFSLVVKPAATTDYRLVSGELASRPLRLLVSPS